MSIYFRKDFRFLSLYGVSNVEVFNVLGLASQLIFSRAVWGIFRGKISMLTPALTTNRYSLERKKGRLYGRPHFPFGQKKRRPPPKIAEVRLMLKRA